MSNKLKMLYFTAICLVVLGAGISPTQQVSARGADSLIQDSQGKIYFNAYNDQEEVIKYEITDTVRKSYGFLASKTIEPADEEDNARTSSIVAFPRSGSIICAAETKGTDTKGQCSQIVEGKKYNFASGEVLLGLGFKFESTITGDTSTLPFAKDISSTSAAHNPGTLINDNGTIKLVNSLNTTLGVASIGVMQSWGLSFNDVVPANDADKKLVQMGTLAAREAGQIDYDPFSTDKDTSEYLALASLLSRYPDYPTAPASSQAELEQIALMLASMDGVEGVSAIMPFITAESVAMVNQSEVLRRSLEDISLPVLSDTNLAILDAVVLGDGTQAKMSFESKQKSTKYTEKGNLYFKKENGSWKLDLLASAKEEAIKIIERTQEPVVGKGRTNLKLESAKVSSITHKGQTKNYLKVKVSNRGKTTVNSYSIYSGIVDKNGELVTFAVSEDNTSHEYALKPKQKVNLTIPLLTMSEMELSAGKYSLETFVIDNAWEEIESGNISDNEKTTQFNFRF